MLLSPLTLVTQSTRHGGGIAIYVHVDSYNVFFLRLIVPFKVLFCHNYLGKLCICCVTVFPLHSCWVILMHVYDVLPHVFCYSRLSPNPLTLVTQVYTPSIIHLVFVSNPTNLISCNLISPSLPQVICMGSMRPANGELNVDQCW